MISVGIIPNPAAGKDIRRLVAHSSVFDNNEKVDIVRRVLLGLDAVMVECVHIMPDRFAIGMKALKGLKLKLDADILDMRPWFSAEDSLRATEIMMADGVGCLVTLGGDGTNRIVSKASGKVALMPISTGTNNVFPTMIEGTIAGIAAGLVAGGHAWEAIGRAPRIEVLADDGKGVADIALVDAVFYAEPFIASRAIWDETKIMEIITTRSAPGEIGFSSIASHLLGGGLPPGHGLHLKIGSEGKRVMAPIAPGLIRPVVVAEHRTLAPGEEVTVSHSQVCVLALDGERELELDAGEETRLRLNPDGPFVVDAAKAVALAAEAGRFIEP